MQKHSSIWFGLLILVSITVLSAYLLNGENAQGNYQYSGPSQQKQVAGSGGAMNSYTDRGEWALANVPQILPIPNELEFAGERVPLEHPDIRERFEKELYITAHRYYQVIFYLKRAPRIFPILRQTLKEKGIPEDFLYLAVIESDLLPTIESPVGAKGIWQFMPSTARRYGLRVDRRIDERMNVEKATRAAADFIKHAKEKTGSWTLACAAYNMGLARTLRTMQAQQSEDYYKLYMNDETSRYVFRILAAKVLIEQPKTYGYSLPKDEEYTYQPYEEVTVTNGVQNLVDWAQDRNTTYYDLKRMNPWILKRYLPRGSYTIRLPKD
jgi:membrane-bound lytic murein transglycosylase D